MNENQSDPRLKAWVLERAPRAAPTGLVSRSMEIIRADPRRRSRVGWFAARRFAFLRAAIALTVLALGTIVLLSNRTPAVGPGASASAAHSTPPDQTIAPTSAETFLPATADPQSRIVDLASGLPYYCGTGETFYVESLSGPGNATEVSDPAAAPVESLAARFGMSSTHWWLVYRSPTVAQFLGRTPSGSYEYIETKLNDDGSWGFKGLGDCQGQYLVVGRLLAVAWSIDPANPPRAGDRELHVIAQDLCPLTLQSRLASPVIRYGLDAILIVLPASTSSGGACGSGQTTALTIQLDQPIGARVFRDGGTWPGRDARVIPPPLSGAGG